MTLVSSHVQRAVLRGASRLRNHPNLAYIFLRRSMSAAERTDRKGLQAHCQKLNKSAPETTKYVLQADGDKVKLCRYENCKINRQTGALFDGTLSTKPISPPTPKKPKFSQVRAADAAVIPIDNSAAMNVTDGGVQATQSGSQEN